MAIQDFINTFNEYYPFDTYILKTPKQINTLFEEILITEIFIPNTNINPILSEERKNTCFTSINKKDIYVNVLVKGMEFKMWFYDFAEHVQENIVNSVIDDFEPLEWENLYIDYEEETKLSEILQEQQKLLILKYGFCNIKNNIYNSQLLLNTMNNIII